jgi:amidase
LPILVGGAMLYLGDAHARQADGECLMTAVEVEARITFECSILESIGSRVPLVNADGNIMTIGHGSTLDGAVDIAFQEMHALLTRAQGWSSADTAMFMSATADVSVCQVVNPRASARVSVPAQYLSPLLPTAR